MDKINKFEVYNPNEFIRWWNSCILKYGLISVADLKMFLGLEPRFIDNKKGWTTKINSDNFTIIKTKRRFIFQLNLPDYKELY